jgi:hypothetical protein
VGEDRDVDAGARSTHSVFATNASTAIPKTTTVHILHRRFPAASRCRRSRTRDFFFFVLIFAAGWFQFVPIICGRRAAAGERFCVPFFSLSHGSEIKPRAAVW